MSEPQLLPEHIAQQVADTMFALSTPSRLQILAYLQHGPRTVGEIVDAVGMEQSAISHQLRVLRDHNVVTVRRLGRSRQYAVRDEYLIGILADALSHITSVDQAVPAPAIRAAS
jgi:DNA-binding transcriptional ArsR family regulator